MAKEASGSRSVKRPAAIDSDDSDADDPRSNGLSPNKRRQSRRVAEEEEDDDDDADLDDLNSNQEIDGEADGDEEVDLHRPAFRPEYERGNDGYVAGSVTRIKMHNFMTYDFVEFRPGPHLNMILGPNGTGKSSIAASIAIGLGFPPKVMGRANELKAYVKQGADEAMVEIELKGKPGQKNIVIQRKFNREDEKSEWRLNGESTTKREVLDVVRNCGIQANNLCSFLPQDKVAEFAKMAPVTVLRETMRAAGDPRLTKWHEQLVEKGAASKELQSSLETHTASRDRLQTQVDSLAPDVEHIREREGREREAEILEHLVRVAEHSELKKQTIAIQKERDDVRKQLEQIESRRQPLRDLNELWVKKNHKAESRAHIVEDNYKNKMRGVRRAADKCDEAATKGKDVDEQLRQLRLKMERKENEKASLRNRIQQAQAIIDEPREDVDTQSRAKTREKGEIQSHARQKNQEIEAAQDEYNDNVKMFRELDREINDLSQKQKMLQNVEVQKENAARDLDGSIGFLLDWLAKEGHSLDGEVFKPPMISVSVPNQKYAWQVEQCTNLGQRKTFICTSQKDYDRIIQLNNTMYPERIRSDGSRQRGGKVALYLQVVEVTEATAKPPKPCSAERLLDMGFDGYAIDYVEAAPAVIAFLCGAARLHTTVVTQRPGREVDTSQLARNGVRAWVTKDDFTRVTQSSYGRRDFLERTEQKVPARAFNLVVDHDAVKRTADEVARRKRTKFDRETPHAELKAKIDRGNKALNELKEAIRGVDHELQELKERAKRYNRALNDIEHFKKKLETLEKEPSAEVQRESLKKEKLKYAKARLSPVKAHQTACEEVIAECENAISAAFGVLQSSVNLAATEHRLRAGNEESERVQTAFAEARQAYNEIKLATANKWEQVKMQIQDAPRAIKEAVAERAKEEGLSAMQAREDLQRIRAQLELAADIPANIVARWEHLSRQLESAKATVTSEEVESAKIKRDIKHTLDVFDPALETLVQAVSAKFSAAFQRVKCQGEVRIRRVEGDFAAWGIEILVSYRDGDSLAILTGSHQSGGERSLATVTYLMSLSEMSRTPFSLVDEINQGMDQRAERNVHNQLVEVTCDSDAGQYFLITPKLLTGLVYHPKMKVLIINNGVWLPDSTDTTQRYGDLKACLKDYRSRQSVAAR